MDPNLSTQAEAEQIPKQHPAFKKLPWILVALASIGLFTYSTFQLGKRQGISQEAASIAIVTPTVFLKPTLTSSTNPVINRDWKTYSNSELGLSFHYPPTYSNPSESTNYISIMSPLNPNRGKGYELQNGELKIEVYFSKAPPNDTIDAYINEERLKNKENIIEEEPITIGGMKTVKWKMQGMGSSEVIFITWNGYRMQIVKYPGNTTRQNEFEGIISTFTFNNLSNTGKNSSWKSYSDKTYQFAFYYPSDWILDTTYGVTLKSPDFQQTSDNMGEAGGTYYTTKGGAFGINITDKTSQMSLNDACHPGGPITVLSCDSLKFLGYDARKRRIGNPEHSTDYIFLSDKYYFNIGMSYVLSDSKMKDTLMTILNSFRFTE